MPSPNSTPKTPPTTASPPKVLTELDSPPTDRQDSPHSSISVDTPPSSILSNQPIQPDCLNHSPSAPTGPYSTIPFVNEPTYSNWAYCPLEGNIQPLPVRVPSPPYDPPSRRQRLDLRLSCERDSVFHSQKAKQRAILHRSLTFREEQVTTALELQSQKLPYRYPAPWPFEMRLRCAQFPDFLEEYYQLTEMVRVRMEESLDSLHSRIQDCKKGMHAGKGQDFVVVSLSEVQEYNMLYEFKERMRQDWASENDCRVMGRVLDAMQAQITQDIEMAKAGKLARGYAQGQFTTQLMLSTLLLVSRIPVVGSRLRNLRAWEARMFPKRYTVTGVDGTSRGRGWRALKVDAVWNFDDEEPLE